MDARPCPEPDTAAGRKDAALRVGPEHPAGCVAGLARPDGRSSTGSCPDRRSEPTPKSRDFTRSV